MLFDGYTYDPRLDHHRLNTQLADVWHVMRDSSWQTSAQTQEACLRQFGRYHTTDGISARRRDFRKPRFGRHTVNRRRLGVCGLFEYQLIPAAETTRRSGKARKI